jgi:gluconokinase
VGERVKHRTDHYMPSSLLPSQLSALEPLQPDEPGFELSAEGEAAVVIAHVLDALRDRL